MSGKIIERLSELPKDKKVLLYGAGLGGLYFRNLLRDNRKDIEIIGFIDDSKEGKKGELPIYKLEDLKTLKPKYDLILITTIYSNSVEEKLKKEKITNYLIISKDFLDILSERIKMSKSFITNFYDMILKEIIKIFEELNIDNINPSDVINEVEAYNVSWDLANHIINKNFKKILENKINSNIETLAIYPCAKYIDVIIPEVKQKFKKIFLFDDYRKGEIDGIKIEHSNNIKNHKEEIDAFFVSTRVKELKDILMPKLIPHKTVWINDIVTDLLKEVNSIKKGEINEILDKIYKSNNPLIFIGGKFYNNYTPMLKLLEKNGYDVFIIARIPEVSHTFPNPAFHQLPFENKYVLDPHQFVFFVDNLNKGTVFIHTEGFLNPQFEGFRTLCSYLYLLIFLRKINIPKILFLYDLIKPFNRNFKFEKEFLKIYKECLKNSSKIILNSNTCEAVNFLKNSLKLEKDLMSFYRYNFKIKKKQKKIDDGSFHIVMVGGFLDDVGDEMRTISEYVKIILSQKIHVHYYANQIGGIKFKQSLSPEQQHFFHVEKTIMDQQDLLYEISKYHAGWMVHNTQKISDMIFKASDQFLKDILFIFLITTVPSAILLFGCAGLPMFINRSMTGILSEFPEDFFIPIELSEIQNLSGIIKANNWEEKYKILNRKKKFFTIEKNITNLQLFLK